MLAVHGLAVPPFCLAMLIVFALAFFIQKPVSEWSFHCVRPRHFNVDSRKQGVREQCRLDLQKQKPIGFPQCLLYMKFTVHVVVIYSIDQLNIGFCN